MFKKETSQKEKFIAMNINFDSLFFPLTIDRQKYRDPSFYQIADRFFALSEKYNFKYTIFVIGRDLENPEVFSRVREWSAAGHEIGNHTYTHETRLGTLPRGEMETEVLKSHEIITRATGVEPRGFISPTWNVSPELVDVLLKANYLYDTSIFPSYFMYLLLLKLKLMKRGRGPVIVDTTLSARGDKPVPLFASRKPYFVQPPSLIKKEKNGLLMLPLPVTPILRIPCWHTISFVFGQKFMRHVLKSCLKTYDNFYYVMHPRDYFDPKRDLEPDFIRQYKDELSVFEGFNIPFSKKEKIMQENMELIAESGRKFVTLYEMAMDIKNKFQITNNFQTQMSDQIQNQDKTPNLILGIGHEHDSGIALFAPDGLTFAANEERFDRQKFTKALPELSLQSLLKTVKCDPSAITAVAVGSRMNSPTVVEEWTKVPIFYRTVFIFFSITRLDRLFFGNVFCATAITRLVAFLTNPLRLRRLRKLMNRHGIFAGFHLYDHHRVHAATAFLGSGFKDAMIVTLDAQGDGLCSTIYKTEDNKMILLKRIAFFHSPGNYYSYITHLFGFKTGREGKVTGLAAYGKSEETADIFRSRIYFDACKMTFVNRGKYRDAEMRYLRRRLVGKKREDISAGVQKVTEEVVTDYIKGAIRKYALGRVRLALAGGVFANVKLNQRIMELPEVEKIFIYPHMGDGGMAAGAVMLLSMEQGWKRPEALPHCYLGPEYHEDEIEKALKEAGVTYARSQDLISEIAECLSEGKIVALFRGRMEYGPRALGNRSILAQATDPNVNDWLNKRLKRSEFMPFAPILKKEDLSLYFSGYEKCEKALEFMTITLNALPRAVREAPAVIHVDGTARPQVVKKEINPFVWELLEAYTKRTGLKILINTSYNMHEEPIVCTPEDAIRAFKSGGLDVLSIGPYIARNI